MTTEMSNVALGGAKGEPGKYLERHSRGRGRMNKATRTLWLVVLCFTTAMPCPPFSKTPAKTDHFLLHTSKVCTVEDTDCLPPTTPNVRLQEQKAGAGVLLPMPAPVNCGWPDPRFSKAFSRRFPLAPSTDRAWPRRPRQFLLYPSVPTKVHLQILLETLRP